MRHVSERVLQQSNMQRPLLGSIWFAGAALFGACSSDPEPEPASPSPSTSTDGNSASTSSTSGGAQGTLGTTGASATTAGGDSVGTTGAGSTTSGAVTSGGTSSVTSGGSASATGGAGATTGSSTTGGSGGAGGTDPGPPVYALPPPSQCHNQDYIDQQEGCIDGDSASLCGGRCNTINACQESSAEKPNADVTFICPRFMLFSDAMQQAALDDGNSNFNYAVVGHDVDQSGIDSGAESTCCQCYQLVYAYPSPQNERQAQANPDNPNPPASGIPIPKPLIVQSFNTAATPYSFDIYMAAGGFGANNACAPGQQPVARSGQYLYSAYPTDGQPSQGGVKPVSLYSECKTNYQWVTTESLSSDACQNRVADACNQIESEIPGLTDQARRSCIDANSPESPYHLNWSVYVMKVECPAHLTEVTGCKLEPQGLPEVDRNALTADAALQNAGFRTTSSLGTPYETTTMEDCCRPSCASKDWVSGRGLASDSEYNAFYSCDANGEPITE